MSEVAVNTSNLDALLGNPASAPIQPTALEKALAVVEPDDAAAETVEAVKFSFRSIVPAPALEKINAAANGVATAMIKDNTQILAFGSPTLEKMNSAASAMLKAQSDIDIPEADEIVNNMLREIDGFQAKYRNAQAEGFLVDLKNKIRGIKYSFKSMVRDSQPIVSRLDLAANEMQKMEIKLRDNQVRGQELHKTVLSTLDDTVLVLAALEAVIDYTREEARIVDEALSVAEANAANTTEGLATAEYKGETLSINELREVHAQIAQTVGQMESSWFDWRQQFFLGFAQAPSIRNIALVSSTLERRCYVFRTMGIPSAKTTLAAWQQAALAKEAGGKGEALADGVNKLQQDAFKAMGETVRDVAMASQTPVVNEETIFAVVDSLRVQCEGLVAADKWGREMRAKNLTAIQAGEKRITSDFSNSRRELIKNAIAETSTAALDAAPAPDADILASLGVK